MSPAPSRVASLDAARGLIVVLMAIDHARGFVARNHPSEFWGTALPDYQGDWLAFVTRLVTHLCAPGFMFLMGAGAALFAASRTRAGWSPLRIAGHLAVRGVVLIVLGQLLENTAAAFGSAGATRAVTYGLRVPGAPGPIPLILGVLYGLGSALAVSALLIRLPSWVLVVLSAACVGVTHWLTPLPSQVGDPISPLFGMLLVPGIASPLLTVYPTIPWLAPTLLGVVFGRALEHDVRRAFRRIAVAGAPCLVAFVVLRASGDVGSFQPVVPGWIGFLNVTKYPPSLTFLLLTLGANFVVLGGARAQRRRRVASPGPVARVRVGAAVLLRHASVAVRRHRQVLPGAGRRWPRCICGGCWAWCCCTCRAGGTASSKADGLRTRCCGCSKQSPGRARRQFVELRPRIPTVT